MKNRFYFFAVLVIFFVLAGCDNKNELLGNWQIESLIKDGVYQQIAVSDINFLMEENHFFVAGNSGVNRFHGIVKMKGKKIIIENLASTRMMGSEEAMEYEDLFLQTITGTLDYEIKDNKLKIINADKKLELNFFKKN